MPELVVVGNCGVDILVPPHEPPPPGGCTIVDDLRMYSGGSAVNTAIVATRLGVSTAFVGVLGDDFLGQQIRTALTSAGVDTKRLKMIAGRPSPMTIVQTDQSGVERVLQHPGTNADFVMPETAYRVPCDVFHLAAPERLVGIWPHKIVDVVRKLKAGRRTVSIDMFAEASGAGGIKTNVREHRHLLELVDIAFMDENEARLISGRAEQSSVVNYFHERGVKIVVIKRGEKGAFVSWRGGTKALGAPRARVVDTTGAGDSFVAGFLAGHIRGLNPEESTALGCTLGALCVREHGPLAGTADKALLARALEPHFAPAETR